MTAEAMGGSPYGPSTVAGPDGSRSVADVELATARSLGVRLARVASALKIVRVTSIRGQDIDSSEYGT
jgi:NAD(P)H dehydrogenase (quinone)